MTQGGFSLSGLIKKGCESVDFKAKYFDLWKTAWAFHQKWHGNDGSDKTWDQIIQEAGALMRESEFLKSLVLCVIDELDRMDKQKRKDGADNE